LDYDLCRIKEHKLKLRSRDIGSIDTMWHWFQVNAVALIGHALTFAGLIVAAMTVGWQLRRQHKSSLLLQKSNYRETLKLQIYQALIQKIDKLSDAQIDAGMYAFGIPYVVENYQRELAAGYNPLIIKQRAPKFSELHFRACSEIAELLIELESWAIAFPKTQVFRVALNAAIYDARETFQPLYTALLKTLPMDPPDGAATKEQILHPPLAPGELSTLMNLANAYKEAMDEIGCYVYDLKIEAQNNLLSELFECKAPLRQPLDPRFKVISAEPRQAEELVRYFENETPWGKNQANIKADPLRLNRKEISRQKSTPK
jgi:hypothetical protein